MGAVNYDYSAFCAAIARRDGRRCIVPGFILRGLAIPAPELQGRVVTPETSMLACYGPLDGHHVGVSKQRIIDYLRTLRHQHGSIAVLPILGTVPFAMALSGRLPKEVPVETIRFDLRALDRRDGRQPVPTDGRTVAEILEDARNGRLCCRRHHDLIERALLKLTRAALPEGCEEFCQELGLVWSLDRDYGANTR